MQKRDRKETVSVCSAARNTKPEKSGGAPSPELKLPKLLNCRGGRHCFPSLRDALALCCVCLQVRAPRCASLIMTKHLFTTKPAYLG